MQNCRKHTKSWSKRRRRSKSTLSSWWKRKRKITGSSRRSSRGCWRRLRRKIRSSRIRINSRRPGFWSWRTRLRYWWRIWTSWGGHWKWPRRNFPHWHKTGNSSISPWNKRMNFSSTDRSKCQNLSQNLALERPSSRRISNTRQSSWPRQQPRSNSSKLYTDNRNRQTKPLDFSQPKYKAKTSCRRRSYQDWIVNCRNWSSWPKKEKCSTRRSSRNLMRKSRVTKQ